MTSKYARPILSRIHNTHCPTHTPASQKATMDIAKFQRLRSTRFYYLLIDVYLAILFRHHTAQTSNALHITSIKSVHSFLFISRKGMFVKNQIQHECYQISYEYCVFCYVISETSTFILHGEKYVQTPKPEESINIIRGCGYDCDWAPGTNWIDIERCQMLVTPPSTWKAGTNYIFF